MKNIRVLEDGNRLIVVLEGYEKSAMNAVVEMLKATVSPLSHIKPHTGEAQFQLKGSEKELSLGNTEQGQKPEPSIKKPAFVEQMEAEAQARQQAANARKQPVREAAETAAEPAQPSSPAQPVTSAQTEAMPQEEVQTAQENYMPIQADEPEQAVNGSGYKETCATESHASAADEGAKVQQKPAEFMNSFELREYIRRTDSGKLSALLRRKGRFPNAMHLLNADDRTLREYVKELLLTA